VIAGAVVATVTAAGTATAATIGHGASPAPRPTASATVPAAPPPAPVIQPAAALDHRGPVGPVAGYTGSLMSAPAPSLAAYQRAATVIDAAARCRLDWPTLAAVARVESDHGRGEHLGHRVTPAGVSVPPIFGAELDGRHHRGAVSDTDRGRIDHDRRWDRPVGPLGLLPSTWADVAVDADGDGVRNPQDVDDASLAAAVVLCAPGHDLSRGAALRQALGHYDTGRGFAAAVLAVRHRYVDELAAVPLTPGSPLVLPAVAPPGPAEAAAVAQVRTALAHVHAAAHVHHQHVAPPDPAQPPSGGDPASPDEPPPSASPSPSPSPGQCASQPGQPTDVPTTGAPADQQTTSTDPSTDGSTDPTDAPTDAPTTPDQPSPTEEATDGRQC